MFLKTEERNEEEKDAGQYSPKGSFGEILHDFRVTLVFQIHPYENQGPDEGHDAHETGGGFDLMSISKPEICVWNILRYALRM